MALAVLFGIAPTYAQLNINKLANLSFGTIDFTETTAVGNITMGSNGNITYGFNTSGSGVGTPGQLLLEADVGTTISIACSTGTLALSGGGTIPITPVNFVIGTANVGNYATGTECAGLSTSVATHTITATQSENTLFIGGLLAINGQTLQNGTYQGSNLGGAQPSFRMLVQ